MAVNNIQLSVVARQNKNSKSRAYNKFYYYVNPAKTLSTRGFLKHIESHGLSIPQGIMSAALAQICSCLGELVRQGIPIKLDGLGTITPYFSCDGVDAGEAPDYGNLDKVGQNMREYIKGLHFRLIPDGTELDNTQSTANLAKASLSFEGIDLGGGQGIVSNDTWKAMQQ